MIRKNTLLDVDTSIVEKNLRITENDFEDDLKHFMPLQDDRTPSKLVKPFPGFCIKTRSNDEKIFINICHTDSIPPPEDISESELIELLESESPSDFKVPMSIGELHPEIDKSGNIISAYDIAIHPTFFQKIENNVLFKQFFITVIFEGLRDKFNILIDTESFTILKNRKVMGTLQMHRIQQREIDQKMNKEKKLIEEIDEPVVKKQSVFSERKNRMPMYQLSEQPDTDILFADVYMPDIISAKDVRLDIGEDRIFLECKKNNYHLDIFVPRPIWQDKITADFNMFDKILTITLPIVRTV